MGAGVGDSLRCESRWEMTVAVIQWGVTEGQGQQTLKFKCARMSKEVVLTVFSTHLTHIVANID